MRRISGSKGAASIGSACMKVPKIIMQYPISSSEYSSIIRPHSEHLELGNFGLHTKNKFNYEQKDM
jgi:hypothetical protein